MTPRSIRRAAERKARKLARKAEKQILSRTASISEPDMPPPAAEPELEFTPLAPERPRPDEAALFTEPKIQTDEAASFSVPKTQTDEAASFSVPKTQTTSSPARLAANRANAELSTGPRSAAGKEVSSLNALKTGLTGRTVLLPSEDVEQYQRHVSRFFAEYDPATDEERDLVQCIADTAWRLLRIPALESALFALARIQFKDMFQDQPAELRASLIEAQALVAFQKQFNNLGIQEARLLRRMTKTRAELTDLQSRRRAAKPKPAAPNGFEFSSTPNTKPATTSAENGSVAHGFSVPERASARGLGGRA